MPPHTVKSTQKAAGRRPAFLRISVVRRAARNINVGRYSGSELTPCLRLPGFPVADILSFLSTFYMHGIWMITFRISFTAYSDEIAQVLPLLPFYLFINRHDRWSAAGP